MNEPNGGTKESRSTDESQDQGNAAFLAKTTGNNQTPEKHGSGYGSDPQDEVEETFRRFGEFVKETFRNATPGERLAAWTNLIVISVAIVAAVVYFGQLTAMQESNQINRESLESVQRAFIGFQNVGMQRTVFGTSGREHILTFDGAIENSGTTPAIQTVDFFNAQLLSKEPDQAEFAGAIRDEMPATIGPKQTSRIGPATLLWKGCARYQVRLMVWQP